MRIQGAQLCKALSAQRSAVPERYGCSLSTHGASLLLASEKEEQQSPGCLVQDTPEQLQLAVPRRAVSPAHRVTSAAEKHPCPHRPGQGKPPFCAPLSRTWQSLMKTSMLNPHGRWESWEHFPLSPRWILLGISSSLKPRHLCPENPRSPPWSRSFTNFTLNDKCPYKKRRRDHGKPHEDRGRDWGHAATHQGMWGHQKLERQGRKSPLEPSGGAWFC